MKSILFALMITSVASAEPPFLEGGDDPRHARVRLGAQRGAIVMKLDGRLLAGGSQPGPDQLDEQVHLLVSELQSRFPNLQI